mgnify:CR=1 FL=1
MTCGRRWQWLSYDEKRVLYGRVQSPTLGFLLDAQATIQRAESMKRHMAENACKLHTDAGLLYEADVSLLRGLCLHGVVRIAVSGMSISDPDHSRGESKVMD